MCKKIDFCPFKNNNFIFNQNPYYQVLHLINIKNKIKMKNKKKKIIKL